MQQINELSVMLNQAFNWNIEIDYYLTMDRTNWK